MTIYESIEQLASDLGVIVIMGSFKEIGQRLHEREQAGTATMPLMLFRTPVEQTIDQPTGIAGTIVNDVEIVFITTTQKQYSTPERITNIYTPTLWVLYDNFLTQMAASTTMSIEESTINYMDYFLYSSELAKDQNKLAAILDAIVLKMDIKLIKTC